MPTSSLPLVFPAPDQETPAVAHFRLLRQRLGETTPPARVVLVTSAGRDEGKSTVAANLALCCAEFGRARVVLVEANFARPSLAAAFGVTSGACFAQYLAERHRGGPPAPLRPVLVQGQSLALLTVTEPGQHASAAWPAFQEALGELRAQTMHDVIVVDGPSAIDSADANIIARQCDQVLLAGIAGRSRAGQLASAAEQLAPATVAGVVLLEEDRRRRRRR